VELAKRAVSDAYCSYTYKVEKEKLEDMCNKSRSFVIDIRHAYPRVGHEVTYDPGF
jgi:hypothetical protein